MNPFLAGVGYALSKRLARHQGRPPRDASRVPLWRLLLDELAYLGRRLRRTRGPGDGSSGRGR